MESFKDRVESLEDAARIQEGRTARVLLHYAATAEQREWIDSDLPSVLKRAARLLRKYCPEVQEYERERESWDLPKIG